ncbi:MAG TPA: hypothetical protein VKE94_04055, partial [Gemmataceae bacterium]|nr:hypothetical protein [Gemmataceae bacterium]
MQRRPARHPPDVAGRFAFPYALPTHPPAPYRETLQTSVAHIFNERGEGIVVRGGPAKISKDDRTPHLDKDDAAKLLKRSLAIYRREHKNFPARLVVHKTSYFTPDETAGLMEIVEEERIDSVDLVS